MFEEEDQIITRYRPQSFDEVIGNETVIKSLKANLTAASRPKAYLFTGPWGCGKTTLMQILVKELGVKTSSSLIYRNAALEGGIDAVKSWVENLYVYPLDGSPAKVLMVDECHEITSKAWTPLLTMIENAPSHAYFIFATSEIDKVNGAFKSRIQPYTVEPLSAEVIYENIEGFAELENINLSAEVCALIAEQSKGSMRQALSHLSLVRDATFEEAQKLIQANLEGETHKTAYNLAEMIFKHHINDFRRYVTVINDICESEKSTWGTIKSTLLNYGNSNMLMFCNLAMMAVFNDVKQMQPYFKDKSSLKAELIEVCACACLHMPSNS